MDPNAQVGLRCHPASRNCSLSAQARTPGWTSGSPGPRARERVGPQDAACAVGVSRRGPGPAPRRRRRPGRDRAGPAPIVRRSCGSACEAQASGCPRRRRPRRPRRRLGRLGRGPRRPRPRPRRRSTTSPLLSLTLAASTTTASALPRATSPTSIGTWPPSTTAWANWSGDMPEDAARRMRCSVSSSWLTFSFSLLTSSSRTNWVLMPLTAAAPWSRRRTPPRSCPGSPGTSQVEAHLAELVVLQVVLAGLDLVLEELLGDRDLDQLEQRVEDLLLGLGGLVVLLHLLQALAAVLAQLLQGVELGGELGEVVVQLGQFTACDLR